MSSHFNNHRRSAELHEIAAHAHLSAAVAHEKQDHPSGHERSRVALEHSEAAFQHSQQVHQNARKTATMAIPSHDEIAMHAFGLWQSRGCPAGSPDIDWLSAERELSARTGSLR